MQPQLPLLLGSTPPFEFEHYFAGSNAEAVTLLRAAALGQGEPFILLWGESGLGKTHLLSATCHTAHSAGRSVIYVPLRDAVTRYQPHLLHDLDSFALVCMDDVDAIAGSMDWEQALFVLFNNIREQGGTLIVTAAMAPNQFAIALPDLKSRLGWGLTLRLNPLNDDDKLSALILYAKQRGLEVRPEVGRFLLARYPRDLPSLWQMLDRLDHATLAAQRKLTIPFLKTVIKSDPAEKAGLATCNNR